MAVNPDGTGGAPHHLLRAQGRRRPRSVARRHPDPVPKPETEDFTHCNIWSIDMDGTGLHQLRTLRHDQGPLGLLTGRHGHHLRHDRRQRPGPRCGKGPTKAKTHISDDVVVVVLEETFTRAEKTLAQRGEAQAIQHIRRRFQQQMAEDFVSVVEQATGRRVRAFLSETNIDEDVSVEVFLLADERTDMSGFESG
jgi:uncharacterized protein YbcI